MPTGEPFSQDTALAPARDLLAFIEACPSPFHAAAHAADRLEAAGFARRSETDAWAGPPGLGLVVRGGSLVAWAAPPDAGPTTPMRLVGAHTDSPNLRVKPRPDTGRAGCRQLALEAYGGVLRASWLDRELGLSGRLAVRDATAPDGVAEVLVRIDEPLVVLPQLAIHLDRDVNERGLVVDAQRGLAALWGLGEPTEGTVLDLVAGRAGVRAADVLAWDLMVHDLVPGRIAGAEGELLVAPRLDNQASCWAALDALVALGDAPAAGAPVAVVALFDHEEVGSQSDRGAGSSLLVDVVERLGLALGAGGDDTHRARAASVCLSADMAHAVHPNHPERHEPGHPVTLNGGPVLKVNANVRYASDAASLAPVVLAAEAAGVPLQRYAHRGDLPCGSTIGPITAARLGMRTADVGAPQLAMHSAREVAGSADPGPYRALMTAFLAGAGQR